MKTYIDRVHTYGRVSILTALCVFIMFPVAVCLHLGVWPEFHAIFRGLIKIVPIYWTTGVIEVFTYTPVLGAGGTYLSFVTGNIANLKLPCALNAMESADVKSGTEEGEVISTIAIATSSIVTTLILAIGVLLFSPVLPSLTKEGSLYAPAFAQVMPALFGALGAGYFYKHWKISIFPIAVMIILLIFSSSLASGVLIPVGIVAAIGGALIMFKMGIVGEKGEKE